MSYPLQFWAIQTLNSLSLGGLLFLLSSGFSLIFGLMRIANLTHGSLFMLGAYIGVTILKFVPNLWLAAIAGGLAVALLGGLLERFVLRALGGNTLGQVLVTLGVSFIIADLCLVLWGGDPIPVLTPASLRQPILIGGLAFPTYRLAVLVIALVTWLGLYLLLERTRVGAMIRAGVDDMEMARAVGIPVSKLFTIVFCLGSALAGAGGIIGGPIMSAYPGLDADMLPLALIVVILGGVGSLTGALTGSFIIGFIYTFGTAMFPDLAYVILFLPMIFVIAFRPRGLFGRHDGVKSSRLGRRLPSRWPFSRWSPAISTSTSAARFSSPRFSRRASICWSATRGLTSLGHASWIGLASYTSAWLYLKMGVGHLISAPVALLGTTLVAGIFGWIALRATGLSFLMITLALSQVVWGTAYRWTSVTNGDNGLPGLTRPAPFGIDLNGAAAFYYFALLVTAFSLWMMARFVNSAFGAAVARYPRPAAADERARLQRLADPLDYLRLFRLLGRRGGPALRVLQQVHSSQRAVACQFGGRTARRDRRRIGHARRSGRRRGDRGDHEELRFRLYRALEHAARIRVRRDRAVHARRPRSRTAPPVGALEETK